MIMCDKMNDYFYRTRMSPEQKAYLIKFMGSNTDFARLKLTGLEAKTTYSNTWMRLAEQLNRLGPKKSATKWKRAWFDLKTKTLRKATLISKTKGRRPTASLTELDEKLISVITEEQPALDLQTNDVLVPHSIFETVLTTSSGPTNDHDYFTEESENKDIVLVVVDEDKTDSKASTQSFSKIAAAPECSYKFTPGSTSTETQFPNQEEPNKNFQASVSKFDKKLDTVIDLLKDQNNTLKNTNALLQELIRVIKVE